MFTVYLSKVVWVLGVEMLTFALALIKCCWVAKYLEKLFYKILTDCKGFVMFWWKNSGAKVARKMLVKLNTIRLNGPLKNGDSEVFVRAPVCAESFIITQDSIRKS